MADAADSIRDHFRRTAPEEVVSVYLFGSEAAGRTHADSDVDVVVLNDAGPEIAAAVVQEGRRLYCTDAERDRRFVRDVILRWSDLRPWLRRMRTLKAESLAK